MTAAIGVLTHDITKRCLACELDMPPHDCDDYRVTVTERATIQAPIRKAATR